MTTLFSSHKHGQITPIDTVQECFFTVTNSCSSEVPCEPAIDPDLPLRPHNNPSQSENKVPNFSIFSWKMQKMHLKMSMHLAEVYFALLSGTLTVAEKHSTLINVACLQLVCLVCVNSKVMAQFPNFNENILRF